jgi:hypothetical protein
MSIRPLLKLLKNDQLLAFTNSAALLKPFYKLVYLAAARKGGGSLEVEVLNLWGAATATGGRLPKRDEIVRQLQDAGYKNVKTIRPMPGEAFYAFKAISHYNKN